jgi:hypothetical protein
MFAARPKRRSVMTTELAIGGVSGQEAAERLAAEGPNLLPRSGRRGFLHIAREGNRSQDPWPWAALVRRNRAFWWVATGSTALLAAIIAFAPTRALFRFGLGWSPDPPPQGPDARWSRTCLRSCSAVRRR